MIELRLSGSRLSDYIMFDTDAIDKLTANRQNNNNGTYSWERELSRKNIREVSQRCETQLINVHGNVSFIMEPMKF